MCDYIFDNEDLFDKALQMQFKDLSNTNLDKDKLIGNKKSKNSISNSRNDEKDILIKYLIKIQEVISLYDNKDINNLIKTVDFKIQLGKHKAILKNKMDELCSLSKLKIKGVLDYIETSGTIEIDSKISDFINTNNYLIERVKRIDFSEITNLYNYTEGLSPYSTQHGVKGDEFNNVLVVISKDKIPQLSVCYEYLFKKKYEEVKYFNRTLNLFYVVCTRAKENLVVFYEGECSDKVIISAKEFFGENNVIDIN